MFSACVGVAALLFCEMMIVWVSVVAALMALQLFMPRAKQIKQNKECTCEHGGTGSLCRERVGAKKINNNSSITISEIAKSLSWGALSHFEG